MSEQNIPLAWMRKWAFDGEVPFKIKNKHGRTVWASKFKIVEVTRIKIFADDVPLFAVNAHSALVEAVQFLMSQVKTLAERSFSEGHKEWLEKCDAYNAGRRAIALAESKELNHETTTNPS